MKQLFYILILCILSLRVFAQNYSIEKNTVEDIVAGYVEELIQNNTPKDSRFYAYSITQNNETFVISCYVTPENFNVTEQTDDLWKELEATIVRAINRVKQSLTPPKPESTYIVNSVSSERVTPQKYNNNTNNSQPQQSAANIVNAQKYPFGNLIQKDLNTCTVDDVRSGMAEVGGKIQFGDGSYGVIFFLNGNGHGLAVSLDETKTKWQNAKRDRDCQDIYQLVNESEPPQYFNSGLGAKQTQMIINQLSLEQAPAAKWCYNHGDSWYLPSAGELWYLFTVANYNTNSNNRKNESYNAKDGFISCMLRIAGGQPIENNWYWSSSEVDKERAWNVKTTGWISSEDKVSEVSVRTIRYF